MLAQESWTAPVSIRVRVGSLHDPRATASGRLLLALLPPQEADREIKSAREQFGGRPPAAAILRRKLGKIGGRLFRGTQRITIRSCGYSCSPAETRTSYPRRVGQLSLYRGIARRAREGNPPPIAQNRRIYRQKRFVIAGAVLDVLAAEPPAADTERSAVLLSDQTWSRSRAAEL